MVQAKTLGNKVVGYCLEMSNQYSPFQYVLERCGAKIIFLKYWSRKKIPGNKVVGCCLGMPIQYSLFQYTPERGEAKIYFRKYWSRKKPSGNKVVEYCLEMPHKNFSFLSIKIKVKYWHQSTIHVLHPDKLSQHVFANCFLKTSFHKL